MLDRFVRLLPLAVTAAASLVLAGCGDDDDPIIPPAATGTVEIALDHQVGTTKAPLAFDSIQFTNAAGNNFSVTKLEYYISDVTLERSDNTTFSLTGANAVHYRDAREAATRIHRIENVPVGDYTDVTFTLGLDETKNVDGFLPATQENLNMEWPPPLGDGYHYMKLEGDWDSGTASTGYNTHTGRSASTHHHFSVTLPTAGFTVEEDGTVTIEVLMDILEWYDDPIVLDFADFGGGIMNNPTIQLQLQTNGASVFSLGNVSEVGANE